MFELWSYGKQKKSTKLFYKTKIKKLYTYCYVIPGRQQIIFGYFSWWDHNQNVIIGFRILQGHGCYKTMNLI